MKRQEYKKGSFLFIPLSEVFQDSDYYIKHIGTVENEEETVHIIAVNAQEKEGIPAALEKDLVLVKRMQVKATDKVSEGHAAFISDYIHPVESVREYSISDVVSEHFGKVEASFKSLGKQKKAILNMMEQVENPAFLHEVPSDILGVVPTNYKKQTGNTLNLKSETVIYTSSVTEYAELEA